MLHALAQYLAQDIRAFNVFNYLTLRAVLASMTALAISFFVGPTMIRKLTAYKIGQSVREDGPQTHLIKAGTPTMGGALILVAIAITTLLWADLETHMYGSYCLPQSDSASLGGSMIIEKWFTVIRKDCRQKQSFSGNPIVAMIAAIYLAYSAKLPVQTELIVPFFKSIAIPLGAIGFILLTYFVVVGSSNAVNLTDGLDGLAIMPTVMIGSALAIFAYVAGNAVFARYLGLPYIAGAGELCVILCRDGRCRTGISLVQRLSSGSIHGRCWCVGPRCCAGHYRGDRQARNCSLHHGRCVCRRNALRYHPSHVFSLHQTAFWRR